MRIGIIPGHVDGGFDPGAVNQTYGLTEAHATVKLAEKIKYLCDVNGFEAVINYPWDRNAYDVRSDINAQVNFGNNGNFDIILAIHYNAGGNGKASGIETLYANCPRYNEWEVKFAQILQDELVCQTGLRDRGIRETPRGVGIIKNIQNPNTLVVLTENGFIDNNEESVWASCDEKQWILAKAHVIAICKYMGKEYVEPYSNEEEVKIMLEQWQREMGEKALDCLAKKGLVSNVESWKKTLGDFAPQWLMFELVNRITNK